MHPFDSDKVLAEHGYSALRFQSFRTDILAFRPELPNPQGQ